MFDKYVGKLVDVLRNAVKSEKGELVVDLDIITFDAMGDLTFAQPLHMLDTSRSGTCIPHSLPIPSFL